MGLPHAPFSRAAYAIWRERGFRAPTRGQFDATSGPDGAFFMGDPQTVADKIARVADQLGGVDRLSMQMTNPRLAHDDLLRGIELLGTEVAPRVATVRVLQLKDRRGLADC